VQRGQTLYSIALAHGVPVKGLAAANGIKNPSRVRAGTRLVIPSGKRAASSTSPSKKPPEHESRPQTLALAPPSRDAEIPDALPPSMSPALPDLGLIPGPLSWPVEGRIISGFDRPRRGHRHQGIDIGGAAGAPIRPVAGGVVGMVEEQYGNYGRLITVEHDNGMVSYYGHNMKNLVKPGQRVSADDVIALVGRSGNASCAHLHFELRLKGEAIDPVAALPTQPR